jgi:hypothetical protein
MTDLNKDLLETSEVYREVSALNCFSDEIEEMEMEEEAECPVDLEALDDIVKEFQYLKEFQHFYDGTLPEIEF